MGMAAGVFVLRGVAASHLTVGHAHPQVDPGIAEFKTLLAAGRRPRDIADLIKVCALQCRLAAYPLNCRANGLQQSHGRCLLSGPLSFMSLTVCWVALRVVRSACG